MILQCATLRPMSEPIVVVQNLRVALDVPGQPVVVEGLDFELRRGRTFALLGESGCGKTMTALSLMQLLPSGLEIAGGEIFLDGTNLVTLSPARMRAVRGLRIAMIFQDLQTSLNPVLSVGHQIAEMLARVGIDRGARRERAIELLELVGIPAPGSRVDAYPHQLSGGMKQRVAIAIALAGEPDVLVADEPTTALDVTIQAQILALLREIQRSREMTIMLITHDLGVVAEAADDVGVMYAGHLVERSSVESFFSKPYHPYAQGLFAAMPRVDAPVGSLAVIPGTVPSLSPLPAGCRFQSRCAHAWEDCRTRLPGWREHSEGHQVRCHLYDQLPPIVPSPPSDHLVEPADELASLTPEPRQLLDLEDIAVKFPVKAGVFRAGGGTVRAVNGVSLSIANGQTLAIVGESGCGKSTLAKAIVQLVRSYDGRIVFEGDLLSGLDREGLKQRRGDIQIIFQDAYASMNPRMRATDIVAEGLTIQNLHGTPAERQIRALDLLAQVGIDEPLSRRYPHELSGGQRQRVCIARALAVEPKLIVCDEPTSALDVSIQAQILNLLKRLQLELGVAYLLISHDISVVSFLAHDVAVMYLGKIVERGNTEEILRDPKHPYTQALMSALPSLVPGGDQSIELDGELPASISLPGGCAFHPRCRHKLDYCDHDPPRLEPRAESRVVACHLY